MESLLLGFIICLTLAGSFRSEAAVLVIPPGAPESVDAGLYPPLFGGPPRPDGLEDRWQQVYESRLFASQKEPFLILGMAFRPNREFGGAFSYENPDISIWLSTTPETEASLDFFGLASHVGADAVEVIRRGPLALSSAGDPEIFDVILTFDEPFFYDPAQGNLLFDVLNWQYDPAGAAAGTALDASRIDGDGMSRAFNFGPGDGFGGSDDSIGLITQFSIQPVPEPATPLLILAGLSALAVRRVRPTGGGGGSPYHCNRIHK
ncbi:MAG: PEP-CTERM sorting domain-containing protein [Verrucomicrobiae bacterium]|nr:PEP-CTERM sorting domain-containing protein [Verrucomicrobiae bacterium]